MQHPPLGYPRNIILLLLCVYLICPTIFLPSTTYASYHGPVIYVDVHATGDNNGTSWEHAYTDLQSALSTAQMTDQIWVAQGVYYPTSEPNDRATSFELKYDVALYGGFAGTEYELNERDWQANPTILSGDIDRNDTHTNGVVIDTTGLVGTNSYHVVTVEGSDSSAILDGFVITAGWANDYSSNGGGAIYSESYSNPTITNVNFSGNSANGQGGAIYNARDSKLTISYSNFSGNFANGQGGAIYNARDSKLIISYSNFSGNSTNEEGGAIYNASDSSQTISDSNFSGNFAELTGGAMYNIFNSQTIINTKFSNNSANDRGGALFTYNSILAINNINFSDNSATRNGGAIYNSSTITQYLRQLGGRRGRMNTPNPGNPCANAFQ